MTAKVNVLTGSGAQKADYRQADNYEMGLPASYRTTNTNYENTIYGNLAETLHIHEYSQEVFVEILDGHFGAYTAIRKDYSKSNAANAVKDVEAGRKKGGKTREARIGVEMNYAPPKSISIHSLRFGSTAALDSHLAACRRANQWIEANLLEARINIKDIQRLQAAGMVFENIKMVDPKKGTCLVKADQAVIISCLHTIARLSKDGKSGGQPQVHNHDTFGTHTLIGDVLCALEWKKVFNNQHLIDAVYKAALREELESRGLQVYETKDGFELCGYTRNDVLAFSDAAAHRIPQFIKEENERRKDPSHKFHGTYLDPLNSSHKDHANAMSRGKKADFEKNDKSELDHDHGGGAMSLDAARAWWDYRAGLPLAEGQMPVNVEEMRLRVEAAQKERLENPLEKRSVDMAVSMAINQLSSRKSYIKNEFVILEEAMRHGLHQHTPEQMIEAIRNRMEKGERFIRPGQSQHGEQLTTFELLRAEERSTELFMNGVGAKNPLSTKKFVNEMIQQFEAEKGFKLTSCQRDSVMSLCTSKCSTNLILGLAGTGKSTSMELVMLIAKANGKDTFGFAPTGQATTEIGDAVEHKGDKLTEGDKYKDRAFTVQYAALSTAVWERMKPGDIVILDEAGLAGSKELLIVQERANKAGVHLILCGDFDQQHSVTPGSTLEMLFTKADEIDKKAIAEGNEVLGCCTTLKTMTRGKDDDTKALHNLVYKSPADAILSLQKSGDITHMTDEAELRKAIAEEYATIPEAARDHSLILTERNAERILINEAVRARLGFDKEPASLEFNSIENFAGIGISDKMNAYNYEEGMIITFNLPSEDHRFKGNERIVVKEVVGRMLKVERTSIVDGVEVKRIENFNPEKESLTSSVGSVERMKIVVGERIRMTATVKGSYKNGDRGVVTAIDNKKQTATIRFVGGKTKEIDLSDKKGIPMRYGYAQTGHSAQGITAKSKGKGDVNAGRVLIQLSDTATSSFNKMYVAITRSTLNKVKMFLTADGADGIGKILKAANKKQEYDRANELHKDSKKRLESEPIKNTFTSKDGLKGSIVQVADKSRPLIDQIKAAAKEFGGEIGVYGHSRFCKGVVDEVVKAGLEKEINIVSKELQKYKEEKIQQRDDEIKSRELEKTKVIAKEDSPTPAKKDALEPKSPVVAEPKVEPKVEPIKKENIQAGKAELDKHTKDVLVKKEEKVEPPPPPPPPPKKERDYIPRM